jgi:predicted Zn-ribbon and HTH transcriptional regulator
VKANELRPNPKNWRTHPESQKNALRGLLAEIGFAGAELARELPDGTLMLIDGHCRAELAGDSEIPVLVLDVDEDEADKILLSFDSIGAMATANKEQLTALLHEVEFENGYVSELIEELGKTAGIFDDVNEETESSAEEIDVDGMKLDCKCPRCGFEFNAK